MSLERSSILGPFPLPPIDEGLRERARKLAGKQTWLSFEDPAAPVDQPLSRGAIQGGYEIDEHGEFTGQYQINALYRPSEQVAGMSLNKVENMVWCASHGYRPAGWLADMLDRAELAYYAEYEGDDRLQVARNSAGFPVLTAFTSSRLIPAEWAHYHLVPGWTVLDTMRDSPVFLDLSPGTPLAFQIMIRDLRLLLTEHSIHERNTGAIPFDAPQ